MSNYDVIIVGARCAGSPAAMLLARKGYRVLLVDRASFPSDTVSTHVLQPLAVDALARFGLLERLVATGCPPVDRYSFDFGAVTLRGRPGTREAPVAYCPRRNVLDALLLQAAADAGAEVRTGFAVEELLFEDGRVVGVAGRSRDGHPVREHAVVVVGADGRFSRVAAAVQAEAYQERPPLQAAYYTYFSSLPLHGCFAIHVRPGRGMAAIETHGGLSLVIAGWSYADFEANKKDVERHFFATLDLVPELGARVRAAKREERFAGAAVAGYFRKPYGPGWALIGDAGYNKDPITAQGMKDAFLDAERCAHALDRTLGGGEGFENAMAEYQRARDEAALPMYELTCQLATLEPPPPPMQRLLGAIEGNQSAMDAFVQMSAGTIAPAQFFAHDEIARRMAAA